MFSCPIPHCNYDLSEWLATYNPIIVPKELAFQGEPEKLLKIPDDIEIQDAFLAGRPDQYISLKSIEINKIHYNLCGQFCVAYLQEIHVMLKLYNLLKFGGRAARILKNPRSGTGIGDLKSYLNFTTNIYKFDSSNRLSPKRLSELAPAIIGVGIDKNKGGEIKSDGKTRHWVVVLQVAPVGLSAWVRVYNPFLNQEEIVLFSELLDKYGRLTSVLSVEDKSLFPWKKLVMVSSEYRIPELLETISLQKDKLNEIHQLSVT